MATCCSLAPFGGPPFAALPWLFLDGQYQQAWATGLKGWMLAMKVAVEHAWKGGS